MSDKKRVKFEKVTTPVVEVKFAWLDRPSTKFNKDGVYELSLILDEETYQSLLAKIQPIAEKAKADEVAKNPKAAKWDLSLPLKPEEDDEGNETGNYVLRAKRNATYKLKDGTVGNATVPIYDTAGKPQVGCKVGRGSKVRAALSIVPFAQAGIRKAGASLRIEGVQVHELVEYSGQDAKSLGFDTDGGGFVGEEDGDEPAPAGAAAGTGGGESAGNGDF